MAHEITGLEALAVRLVAMAAEGIAYLSLKERISRVRLDAVSRFEWDLIWARREGHIDREEIPEEEVTNALIQAATAWIRETIESLCETPQASYRVYVYKSKAAEVAFTTTLHVTANIESSDDDDDESEPFAIVQDAAASTAMRQIGASLVTLVRTFDKVLAVASKTADASLARHTRQVDQYAAMLEDRDDQIAKLIGSILENRNDALLAREAVVEAAEERLNHTRNVQHGMDRLAETVKALAFAHKGVPPELAPALETILARPEMVAAMRDPKIIDLLRDPQASAAVVGLLQQFAAQHAAAQTPPAA